MSENETETPAKVRHNVEPMTLEERAAHYASPGVHRNPKTGKPVRANGSVTPARRRRLKHKENRAIARQVATAQAKVDRLRGAAKKSAQKTLDRLKAAFK